MNQKILKTLFVLLAALLINCASSYFSSTIEPVGQYSSIVHRSGDKNPELYLQTTLDGIEVLPDRINVDTKKYDIIGRIDVFRDDGVWFSRFSKYNEEWRKKYCPVASIITFSTVFSFFFLGIPCIYESADLRHRFEERRVNIIKEMLKKGKEVGATHIVYARFIDNNKLNTSTSGGFGLLPISISGVNMAIGASSSKSTTEVETFKYSGMVGLAVRAK